MYQSSSSDYFRGDARPAGKGRETGKNDPWEAFQRNHPKVAAWIQANQKSFEFARSMRNAIGQYGHLTVNQMAACERCMARSAARKPADSAKTIDVSKLEAAFAKARSDAAADDEGVKWLKLHLDTFRFSNAPATDKWPAAIFVKQGDTKLGRIVAGKFLRGYGCDAATEARIVAAAADPAKAAIAYGLRTGVCSCCGRELTNPESRARGIGPICAEKYGF